MRSNTAVSAVIVPVSAVIISWCRRSGPPALPDAQTLGFRSLFPAHTLSFRPVFPAVAATVPAVKVVSQQLRYSKDGQHNGDVSRAFKVL